MRLGKYPPLFTDAEANNCFSIQHKFNASSQIVIIFSDEMGFARHFFLRKPPGDEQGARERSSRATVSLEEQMMSKDNYSCIFPKLEVVYCLYYSSNISSHSESSGAEQVPLFSNNMGLASNFFCGCPRSRIALDIPRLRNLSNRAKSTIQLCCTYQIYLIDMIGS